MDAVGAIAVVIGVIGAGWIISSAVRTVVIPRTERVRLTAVVLWTARRLARFAARHTTSPAARHRILGSFAPSAMIALPGVWSAGLIVSFALIFWGIDSGSWTISLGLSGSSFTTLGFSRPPTFEGRLLAVIEGLLGLAMVALMISFLPSLYGTYSRREVFVGRFAVRAGQPARPAAFIVRLDQIGRLDEVGHQWEMWEDWFVELGETHTSFPALIFFRSGERTRSWLGTSEAILDTAALLTATQLVPRTGEAETLLRAGYLSLRAIADYHGLEPEQDPADGGELSVRRQQFDDLLEQLAEHGLVPKVDRDAAWQAFWGWRVNYDQAVCSLRRLIVDEDSHWDAARLDAPVG